MRPSYSYSNNFKKRNTSLSSSIFWVVEMPVLIVFARDNA